jgi:hypothetical protein
MNVGFYRAVMSLVMTWCETVNTRIRVCHVEHNHALSKELTELKTVMEVGDIQWNGKKLKMSEIYVEM